VGNFYSNYTVRGSSQQAVTAALAGRKAFVSPIFNGSVVVFDQESDNQDQPLIGQLALRLSKELHCPVMAVLVHDDDILWYQLCEDGALSDEYNSTPGYFDVSATETAPPSGGAAEKLCAAFGATEIASVERILRMPSCADDGYIFESERHADLIQALGLPPFVLGNAYASFARGEFPEGLSERDMMSSA
jgi:hypothetical protein